MRCAIKFCGLTRPVDARTAASLAVEYGGLIFAGGPRSLSDEQAQSVAGELAAPLRRVGVMGRAAPRELAARAERLGLNVIQLHADPAPNDVASLREVWAGEIWAVVRDALNVPPGDIMRLMDIADAVVLDSGACGTPGGTGVPFDWTKLSLPERRTGAGKLVLAGGLTAANVAAAIRAVCPDVVDVSSGVESSQGVKDHEKMRTFVTAVRSATGE